MSPSVTTGIRFSFILALLALLALAMALSITCSAGSSVNDPDYLPGVYTGIVNGQGGSFMIVASSSAVTRVRATIGYSTGVGSYTTSTLEQNGSWPILGNKFSISASLPDATLKIDGELDGSGDASGTITLGGDSPLGWFASLNGGDSITALVAPVIAIDSQDSVSAVVSMSCPTTGSAIYFNTFGKDPELDPVLRTEYAGPFRVSRSCTIKAISRIYSEYSELSSMALDFSDANGALGAGAWIRTIGTPGDDFADGIQATDSGIALLGSAYVPVAVDGLVGTIIDRSAFSSVYSGLAVGAENSLFYWEGGTSTLNLARLDASGSVIWNHAFDYSFPNINNGNAFSRHALLPLPDGGLVAGVLQEGRAGLLSLASDGSTVVYVRFVGVTFTDKIDRIIQVQSVMRGGAARYLILAAIAKPSVDWNGDRSYALIETDTSGGVIRAIRIDSGLADLTAMWVNRASYLANPDGSGVLALGLVNPNEVTTKSALIAFDPDWNCSGMMGFNVEGAIAARADEGYFVALPRLLAVDGQSNGDIGLIKFDAQLGTAWAKSWGGNGYDVPSALLVKDGYVYLAGTTYSYGLGDMPEYSTTGDIWLLKITADGSAPVSSPAHGRYGDSYAPEIQSLASPTVTSIDLVASDLTASLVVLVGEGVPTFGSAEYKLANQYPAGN